MTVGVAELPEQAPSDRKRRIALGGYAAGLTLWIVMAFWIAPALLRLAHQGSLPLSDVLLSGRARVPLSTYLELWKALNLWVTPLGATAILIVVERRWIRLPLLSIGGLAIGAFCFHLAALRSGIAYGSDGAAYLLHARNIVEGIPYARTGYIPNPGFYHAPPTYPPFFPLILAPFYAVSGLALHPIKVLIVASTVIASIGIYALARRFLSIGPSLLAAWLFAFSPFVRYVKDDLLSDLPFAAIFSFCLWAAEPGLGAGDRTDAGWKRGIIVGLLTYVAFATRSIGVVLLPVLLVADFLRVRRISRYAVAVGVIGAGLIGLQEIMLSSVAGYAAPSTKFGFFGFIAHLMRQASVLRDRMGDIVFGGLPVVAMEGATAVAIILGIAGALLLVWRQASPTGLFVFAYAAGVLAFAENLEQRLFMPLAALLPILVCVALRDIHRLKPLVRPVMAGFVLLLAWSYTTRHRQARLDPLPDDYTRSEHVALAAFTERETRPEDVFVSVAPRTVALITRRPGSIYNPGLSFDEQWNYFRSIHAKFVLLHTMTDQYSRGDARSYNYLSKLVETYPDRLKLVFANERYHVYQIVTSNP